MLRLTSVIVLFMIMGGCIAFPPETRLDAPLEMPRQYSLYTEGEPGPDRWWRAFDSRELNSLVQEALSNNFDIQTAWAKLRQADSIARQAGALLMPTVNYDAGAEQKRRQTQLSGNGDKSTREEQSWRMGLAASYELDLWGRLHSQRQAEVFNLQAAREDLDAAAVTVSAKVVETWVDILAVRRKITILNEQIQMNVTLLDLQKLRFSNGVANALDVSQQRETLAAAKAELPLLQLSERRFFNSLLLLTGKAAAGKLELKQNTLPDLIPLPPAGLPADLLASRPDVRAAGLRLRSADWEISAARADRLPAMTLSAQAAFSSAGRDLLFDNWVTGLAAAITGPLFDAGKRKAEVERTRAVAEQFLAGYAKTVAEAVKEVEDSLVTEARQREYIDLLKNRLDAARLTLKNAAIEYRNGQSDYLSYLIAWISVQNLERQLVGEQAILIKNRVALYRTLGGDWTQRLVSSDSPAAEDKTQGEQF